MLENKALVEANLSYVYHRAGNAKFAGVEIVAHNAGVEIAGVEFSAPNIRAGKRGTGNLGRRKSMEKEAIIIADCIG